LRGTVDVLAYIDKAVDNIEGLGGAEPNWSHDEVRELLADIREGLTADPEWSVVTESNLRTQFAAAVARADAAVAEAAEEQATHEAAEARLRAQLQAAKDDAAAVHIGSELAAALYDGAIADLRRQVESARRIAVALEQENAEAIDVPGDSGSCAAELWSWSYFSPLAVDGYWMRCDLIGAHAEHENSETGATWSDPKPEGEGNGY